jgi:hypothetical protein
MILFRLLVWLQDYGFVNAIVFHFPDSEDQLFSPLLKINLRKQVYSLLDGLGTHVKQ